MEEKESSPFSSNDESNNRYEEQSLGLDDKNYLFVVALDFGTTYSGYAFSSRDQFRRKSLEIETNQCWIAGGTHLMSLKTSTSLLVDKEGKFVAFGYEAEDKFYSEVAKNQRENYMLFRRFKMKLHNKKGINENMMLEDIAGKKYPAKQVFTLSIKALVDHVKEKISKEKTRFKLAENDIKWILTVPAIWRDVAKKFMRECASDAGIPDEMLKIALEPEAASIYCQFLPIERNQGGFGMTKEGTRYMVVDIGGGTADITVHEKVTGGRLRELHQATGGACGGTAVDGEFEKSLTDILGVNIMEALRKTKTDIHIDIFREFEVAKRNYNPKSTDPIRFSISPVALNDLCEEIEGKTVQELFKNAEGMKLIKDKLHINAEMMKKFFEPSVNELIQHMQKIIQSPQTKGISIILLVGGAADSRYIQAEVENAFDFLRLVVPPDTGLAVLKGAVLFGHEPSLIRSRILRFSYGTKTYPEFDASVHKEEKKTTVDGVDRCENCFDMILAAGTEVEVGHTEIESYSATSEDQHSAWVEIFCSQEKDVQYTDDEGCFLLGKLFVPFPMNFSMGQLDNDGPQEFKVKFIFGDTELQAKTGNHTCCILKMKEEGDENEIGNEY